MTTPHIERLFDADSIQRQVQALGAEIGRLLTDEDPLLISVLGGSVIFLSDLVRAIPDPVRYEFIEVGSTESGQGSSAEVLRLEYPLPLDIDGQSVLLLKDVVSTGVVETYLEQQLRQHGAREVRCAALIDMPRERKTGFAPDYGVFETNRTGHLVGYGMKHRGRYGNLPYIGVVSEDGSSS